MPVHFTSLPVFLAIVLLLFATPAFSLELAPFKDQLFAYPPVLESSDDGAYRVVDYREARDINGRDAVPERRAHGRYVATDIRRVQRDLVARTSAGPVPHFAVGAEANARIITIYLHGQGGNRHQGVNDFSFGGNFNRIKNLMGRTGGLYLSPDVTDFGAKGAEQMLALLSLYAAHSPRAPIFIACGSMGGALCWRLARGAGAGLYPFLGADGDDFRLRRCQCGGERPVHHSADEALRLSRSLCRRRGGDLFHGRPDHAADYGRGGLHHG
jgi:hypothetical protein